MATGLCVQFCLPLIWFPVTAPVTMRRLWSIVGGKSWVLTLKPNPYPFFFCIPLLPFPSCSSFPVTSTDYVPFICHLSCPLPSSISVLFSLYVVFGFPLIGVCWPANLFVLYHHLYQSIIIFCPSISFLFLLLLCLFMVSWHLLFSSQFSFSFSHLSLWCSSGFTVSLNSGLGIQFCEKYWSGSFTLKGKG